MTKLDLKVWRDLKRMKLRGLTVIVAVAFGVSYYGGYYMAVESIKYSYIKISKNLNLADLQVFVDPSTEEELPTFDHIPGIKVYKKRLITSGSAILKSKENLPVYVIYDDFDKGLPINNFKILEGEDLSQQDDNERITKVLIDRTMASVYGFKVGDRFTVTLHGTEEEMEVKGVVLSPEFIYPSASPNLLLAAKGSLGVIFCSMKRVKEFFGYPLYNNLAFIFAPDYDARQLEKNIHKQLSNIRIEAFIPQRESLDQKIMNWGYQISNKFGPIASIVIVPVVFIILYINIARMMEERRCETGILISVGWRKRAVIFYFLKMNLVYVLVGLVLGFGGSFLLNPIIAVNFAKQLEFPELHCVYLLLFPIRGTIYGIIISLLAFTFSSLRIWRLNPNEAIMGEVPRTRPALPLAITHFEKRYIGLTKSLFLKYAFRSMLRRRNLTIITIISISFALALAISFNILITSADGTLKRFFDHDPWNFIIDFRGFLDSGEIKKALSNGLIDKYEGYIKGIGQIEVDNVKSFGQIIGIESRSSMRRLEIIKGRDFSNNNANEVILNKNLWKGNPLELGQKIIIETTNGQRSMDLVGIVDEVSIAIEYAYLPIGTAQKVLDREGNYTGIWANSQRSSEELKGILNRNEMITKVTPKHDIQKIIDETFKSYKAGIRASLTMSMLVAPILLFTSMGLGILEKERDFIILRSMGFKRKEISKILMTEALVVGFAGAFLSLGLALVMGVAQNSLTSHIHYSMTTYVKPSDYTYIFLCFPLFPLVALIFTRRIMRLDIVDRLTRRIS